MDKVTLDGKEYEKSAVVAKRFGYTTDYMGQLSRGGKIDAQLVGRSWYVHAPSVEEYQAGLYDTEEDSSSNRDTEAIPIETEKTTKTPINNPVSAQAKLTDLGFSSSDQHRESVTGTNFLRTKNRADNSQPPKRPTTWRQISYVEDDTELVPNLSEKTIENKVIPSKKEVSGVRVHINRSGRFSVLDPNRDKTKPKQFASQTYKTTKISDRRNRHITDYNQTQHQPSTSLPELPKSAVAETNIPTSYPWLQVTLFALLLSSSLVFAFSTVFVARVATYSNHDQTFSQNFNWQSWGTFFSSTPVGSK